MKYAKKIALNDLHLEFIRVTRLAASVRKSALSLNIRRILNNQKKNDDQKVKDYVFARHRFLNAGRKLPQLPTVHLPPPPRPQTPPPPETVLFATPPPFDYIEGADDRKKAKLKKRKAISPTMAYQFPIPR